VDGIESMVEICWTEQITAAVYRSQELYSVMHVHEHMMHIQCMLMNGVCDS